MHVFETLSTTLFRTVWPKCHLCTLQFYGTSSVHQTDTLYVLEHVMCINYDAHRCISLNEESVQLDGFLLYVQSLDVRVSHVLDSRLTRLFLKRLRHDATFPEMPTPRYLAISTAICHSVRTLIEAPDLNGNSKCRCQTLISNTDSRRRPNTDFYLDVSTLNTAETCLDTGNESLSRTAPPFPHRQPLRHRNVPERQGWRPGNPRRGQKAAAGARFVQPEEASVPRDALPGPLDDDQQPCCPALRRVGDAARPRPHGHAAERVVGWEGATWRPPGARPRPGGRASQPGVAGVPVDHKRAQPPELKSRPVIAYWVKDVARAVAGCRSPGSKWAS